MWLRRERLERGKSQRLPVGPERSGNLISTHTKLTHLEDIPKLSDSLDPQTTIIHRPVNLSIDVESATSRLCKKENMFLGLVSKSGGNA
jgi:hypothetical protein